MNDEFINWKDLDLDFILGEENWTDGEDEAIYGPESEWESSDDTGDGFGGRRQEINIPEKENVSPVVTPQPGTLPATSTSTNKIYQCPLCEKTYKSTSGFRGHVIKKHDRPDIKAHMNQKHRGNKVVQDIVLPKAAIPLTTEDQIEKEMPTVVNDALRRVAEDKFHSLPSSSQGYSMITISQQLLKSNLQVFYVLLLTYLVPILTSAGPSNFLQQVDRLRRNPTFIESACDFIFHTITYEAQVTQVKLFIQRFITCFTCSYKKRQVELMNLTQNKDVEDVSKNDKQVIFYICGYIIHALRKRYLKAKKKSASLLNIVDNLVMKNNDEPLSEWTCILDRGGLKRPCPKFFRLVVQVERWLREVVDVNNLDSDTLVVLKVNLMDYNLLKASWGKIIPHTGDTKWLLLDQVLSLFLKVRGFALTKLLRKQLQKKRKTAKSVAGSRKALRKELHLLSK